ncbi:MAG TPA: DUF1631 family protein [Ramlibacter sp.]
MSGAATPTAPAYQAIYRACMKEAASQGRALMLRIVKHAVETLQRRAITGPDEVERRQSAEAARTLVKHETALCDAYPQVLLTEITNAISGDARKAGAVSFDSLQLMGEEQVRENVELMRMQQAVNAQVEAELAGLNALIATVQGLRSVQADRNPLRPEVYVRSLRNVSMQSPIPSSMRARWITALGEALGAELARVYTELAKWMRAQGVVEAQYAAAGAPGANVPAQAKLLNLRELRKLVTGDFREGSREAERPTQFGATQFGATMPAAVDALEDMNQVDELVQRMRARQRAESQALAGGGDSDRDPTQVLAQEVVHLMLDTIANDPRLLSPIQQCVRELEPAFMRLALEDPRFFSDKQHPARRLLEELTQRSFAFESVVSPGFNAFIEPLRQAVEVLRETRVPGAEPFDFAIKTLEDAWSRIVKRDREHKERAVRALLNAEQRNLLADKLSRGLRQRPDLHGAPREIVAFVTGPWAQVIAQARLTDMTGSHDPAGYTSILTDLIWSAQPTVAASQSARLVKLIPRLIEKVRQGLSTIEFPQESTDRFLEYLANLHRHALRGTAAEAPKLPREMLEKLVGEGDAWLAPNEAQDSGFIDTHAALLQMRHSSAAQEAELAAPSDQFQPGAWFEMITASGWERFQVTWASPHGTLFIFTGKSGEPQSMTRQLLSKLLETGAMKLVSGQAVVDGALDAVAERALRNSVS